MPACAAAPDGFRVRASLLAHAAAEDYGDFGASQLMSRKSAVQAERLYRLNQMSLESLGLLPGLPTHEYHTSEAAHARLQRCKDMPGSRLDALLEDFQTSMRNFFESPPKERHVRWQSDSPPRPESRFSERPESAVTERPLSRQAPPEGTAAEVRSRNRGQRPDTPQMEALPSTPRPAPLATWEPIVAPHQPNPSRCRARHRRSASLSSLPPLDARRRGSAVGATAADDSGSGLADSSKRAGDRAGEAATFRYRPRSMTL